MQRAADLLNYGELGFGAGDQKVLGKRKLDSPSPIEGVTCYADPDVLKMLKLKHEDIFLQTF